VSRKRRILALCPSIPYPLDGGGRIARFYFLELLSQEYSVTLLLPPLGSRAQYVGRLRASCPMVNIVTTDIQQKSSRSSKLYTVVSWLVVMSKKLLVLPGNQVTSKKIQDVVRFETAQPDFARAIIEHLKHNSYDIIQVEYFGGLNLLPLLPAKAWKVFVYHEILSKRFQNEVNIDPDLRDYFVSSTKLHERSLLELADVVLVFNDDDQKFLSGFGKRVIVSPYGIPEVLIVRKNASSSFTKLFFLGSEKHLPNFEGLTWFLDEVYIPNYDSVSWPIYVLGNWGNETKARYKKYTKIVFTGFLDSLDAVYDQGILISPIRAGSGLRTKILEALANHIPVISTRFGAEGLFSNADESHLMFFENSEDFMNVYNSARQNAELLHGIAVKGNCFYQRNFNSKKLLEARKEAFISGDTNSDATIGV
jgi:glycosyltransferase involved in cell wall biosynthesis